MGGLPDDMGQMTDNSEMTRLFNEMKRLDPNSVVRESEFRRALMNDAAGGDMGSLRKDRSSLRKQFETPNIDGTMSLSSIDPEELRRIDPERPFIKNYDRLENLVEVAGIPLDIALQLNDAMPEDIDDFSEEYDNFIDMFLEASMERED
tara:strand:+ start:60 stop:506 length:447 start_codon:yes stop_codon:yes gene_type:complete